MIQYNEMDDAEKNLLLPPSPADHELTLFFFPSPGVNWKSPASLTLTSAAFKLTRMSRAIGHVTVMLKSKGQPDLFFHLGMTQVDRDEGRAEVLKNGYGLSILSHNFKGRLENEADLNREILKRSKKKGRLSYLRFEINRSIAIG